MDNVIVVEKYGKNGPKYLRDTILHDSTSPKGVRLISTAAHGTIWVKGSKVEFGPLCKDGITVYQRIKSKP